MNSMNFSSLIHSATYYLSYQNKIGRDFMIDESTLKYPIADYLTSLKIPSSKIKLEFSHPELMTRYIDLVVYDNTKKRIETAFEFKIAKSTTKYNAENKRIFNDLMRLYLIAKSFKSECYFLIAGTQSNFIQNFRSIVSTKPTIDNNDLPNPIGFYSKWFNFRVGSELTFEVKNEDEEQYEMIYNAFLSDYKPKKDGNALELPKFIKTKCVAISALSRDFPTPYVGAIWKIYF